MKIALTTAQNRILDERREAASDALRKTRDEAYQVVLAQQRFDRTELSTRLDAGIITAPETPAIGSWTGRPRP